MNRAVISVGSNVGAEANVAAARGRLAEAGAVVAESQFIWTTPIGVKRQPAFLNGVILLETTFGMEELKTFLHRVEDSLGRRRTDEKYGPRTIDLDVLIWNGRVVHEDVGRREFLKDLIPQVTEPRNP